MASGLKDLRLWQEAVALAADVVRAVRTSSRRETKAFTDELMSAATAVAAGIADAHGRYLPAEQQASYRETRRALAILETRLAIARQAELISAATLAQCTNRITNVARLLSGYLGHLERMLEGDGKEPPARARGAA
jgi:four helix bundle protein